MLWRRPAPSPASAVAPPISSVVAETASSSAVRSVSESPSARVALTPPAAPTLRPNAAPKPAVASRVVATSSSGETQPSRKRRRTAKATAHGTPSSASHTSACPECTAARVSPAVASTPAPYSAARWVVVTARPARGA